MDIKPASSSTSHTTADVMATSTAPRVTPTDGPTFREVMNGGAQTLLRGATAAVRTLPVSPILAASVRPVPMGSGGSSLPHLERAEGVGADLSAPGVGGGGPRDPAVEGALADSAEMNLYFLELQERIAAENRAYTAYSNVLKARHDTVKNAIGNIR